MPPGREACVVRELRTNTPLQSLNLMNDVTFLEAARKMAERMMREGGSTPAERIAYGFELATAHQPEPARVGNPAGELRLLSRRIPKRCSIRNPISCRRAKRVGMTKLDAQELAAYTAVASLILNLDATLTKD